MKKRVTIFNASFALQAAGSALSDLEMSCPGKAFLDDTQKFELFLWDNQSRFWFSVFFHALSHD
jgi:hypothetical protein